MLRAADDDHPRPGPRGSPARCRSSRSWSPRPTRAAARAVPTPTRVRTLPDALLATPRISGGCRPQAAPPAGYYSSALIAHPVVVTNFREIYNDHIGAHIMAFRAGVRAGFHHYFPRQLRREWRPGAERQRVIHWPKPPR